MIPACIVRESEEQAIWVHIMAPLLLQEQVLQPSSAAKLSPTAWSEQALATALGATMERLFALSCFPQAERIKSPKDKV